MSQIKNRKHCLSTKTNTRRADEWNDGQFFLLLLFSARKEMTTRKPTLHSQIWADIYYTLYFPNYNPWAELLLIYLTIFLPFGRKRYFEETNNCTRRFTRHILFDANRNALVKRTGCFLSTKYMASPKHSLLTQIRVNICRTLYPSNDNPWAYSGSYH